MLLFPIKKLSDNLTIKFNFFKRINSHDITNNYYGNAENLSKKEVKENSGKDLIEQGYTQTIFSTDIFDVWNKKF